MVRIKPTLIALTLALTASAAGAQSPGVQPQTQPYTPPIVNPYLNLINRGNPAINYYGIVRPEIQANKQFQVLQYGLARTEAEAAATEATNTTNPGALPNTGHVTGFMTYTKYFNTVSARGR